MRLEWRVMLVEKGPLNYALQRLRHVATGDETTALGCVHLDAADGQLVVSATNQTNWLCISMPCDGEFKGVLPAKALLEFTEPSDQRDSYTSVEFMSVEQLLVVIAFECAMVTLQGMPVGEFPDAPNALNLHHVPDAWRQTEAERLAA